MLLENLVTRRVSEENASKSSLTRRVTKPGYLLLAALRVVDFLANRSAQGLAVDACDEIVCANLCHCVSRVGRGAGDVRQDDAIG